MEPKEELYDLSKDAFELDNLISNPIIRKELDYMRQLYDDFVAIWKDEAVPYNDYPKYSILFNRHISWKDKKHLM